MNSSANWRRRDFSGAVTYLLKTVTDRKRRDLLADLTPHDLRDTAATLAFKAGASVKEVSVMLGHADPAITLRRYTGVLESMSTTTDDALDAMFRTTTASPPPAEAAKVVAIR
jgi:integrase